MPTKYTKEILKFTLMIVPLITIINTPILSFSNILIIFILHITSSEQRGKIIAPYFCITFMEITRRQGY